MNHKGAHSNIWIVDARWRDDTAPLRQITNIKKSPDPM